MVKSKEYSNAYVSSLRIKTLGPRALWVNKNGNTYKLTYFTLQGGNGHTYNINANKFRNFVQIVNKLLRRDEFRYTKDFNPSYISKMKGFIKNTSLAHNAILLT